MVLAVIMDKIRTVFSFCTRIPFPGTYRTCRGCRNFQGSAWIHGNILLMFPFIKIRTGDHYRGTVNGCMELCLSIAKPLMQESFHLDHFIGVRTAFPCRVCFFSRQDGFLQGFLFPPGSCIGFLFAKLCSEFSVRAFPRIGWKDLVVIQKLPHSTFRNCLRVQPSLIATAFLFPPDSLGLLTASYLVCSFTVNSTFLILTTSRETVYYSLLF